MHNNKSSPADKRQDPEHVPETYSMDAVGERLLSLREAVDLRWLPKGRGGRPISPSSFYRWATDGRHGVRLPGSGGTNITTTEGAIRWAYLRVSEIAKAKRARGSAPRSLTTSTPCQRERAQSTLDLAGI